MSYEGYIQKLCKNGHYRTCDAYIDYDFNVCDCGQPFVWENSVDVTNGSFCPAWDEGKNECCEVVDENGDSSYCTKEQHDLCKKNKGRIDGYVELEILKDSEYEECKCCGHKKMIYEATYKVPEGKGQKVV